MHRLIRIAGLALSLVASVGIADAGQPSSVRSPVRGVLCDRHICANDQGLSRELTAKYLGRAAARRLESLGEFDPTAFTFSNGVFCDVKERVCRANRFYGPDGKHNGVVLKRYTTLLFGK
jgi:hypothetical protein